MSQEEALSMLAEEGYQIDSVETSTPSSPAPGPPENHRGRLTRDGEPLTMVIGVADDDPTSAAVANTAADQLRSVGIDASVSALDPVVLYGDALTNNTVDAVVGWRQAGGDLATALASRYGCPALQATPVPTTTALPSGTPASSTTTPARPAPPPEPPGTTTAVTPAPAPESDELIQAPSNITGICDPSIQPLIDAALRGSRPVGEVIDDVEPVLWDMAAGDKGQEKGGPLFDLEGWAAWCLEAGVEPFAAAGAPMVDVDVDADVLGPCTSERHQRQTQYGLD